MEFLGRATCETILPMHPTLNDHATIFSNREFHLMAASTYLHPTLHSRTPCFEEGWKIMIFVRMMLSIGRDTTCSKQILRDQRPYILGVGGPAGH
ncbi:hypothetical protein MJO28_014008 [Puccinia striiformis f. sp. tritici]|uniref:Uncharacterized protein n=1 Tax=Puccinia striiformis f. sp. tritici TaxID=168172 RepID=A0ACC0DW67_9BASI|nr:hypothetical protein MJO28_014008 [Puccinia striiformis f. sp. tritici]